MMVTCYTELKLNTIQFNAMRCYTVLLRTYHRTVTQYGVRSNDEVRQCAIDHSEVTVTETNMIYKNQ